MLRIREPGPQLIMPNGLKNFQFGIIRKGGQHLNQLVQRRDGELQLVNKNDRWRDGCVTGRLSTIRIEALADGTTFEVTDV